MKQTHKDKIKAIRQAARLNIVDIQSIMDIIEADIQMAEKRIKEYDAKYELTYSQEEKYDELQDKCSELSDLKENLDEIITALEDVVFATDFVEFD